VTFESCKNNKRLHDLFKRKVERNEGKRRKGIQEEWENKTTKSARIREDGRKD